MAILSRRDEKLIPAVGAPEFVVPVIIGNRGQISGNFLYNPATGALVHTLAMQRKGEKAISRRLVVLDQQIKLRQTVLKAHLLYLRLRLVVARAIGVIKGGKGDGVHGD
jgi:hypothetical protein